MAKYNSRFLEEAVRIATDNVRQGCGGPFGAVVVKDGEIIASSVNTVVPDIDPTAHAEVNVIRQACKMLNSHQLEGCDIYASCEPCPMCMGAIYWARPDNLYYASTKDDAAAAGFDDSFIYKQINIDPENRTIPFINKKIQISGEEFNMWKNKTDKICY